MNPDLGAVLGSQTYKQQYCKEKVTKRKAEIETLYEIAKNEGYESKFKYFMRTIESFEDYVEPIHETLNSVFLPTILFMHIDTTSRVGLYTIFLNCMVLIMYLLE